MNIMAETARMPVDDTLPQVDELAAGLFVLP
jgi:hypothetical protein